MRKLNPKQQRFAEEYIVDLNITQAAIRAGYSPKTAGQQGFRLLKNAQIQAAVSKALDARSKRTAIDADRVLTEYARIAFGDVTDVIAIKGGQVVVTDTDQLDDAQRAMIAEIAETKDGIRVKMHSKIAALDSTARHLGMFSEDHVHRHVVEGDKPFAIEILHTQMEEPADGAGESAD